MDDTTLASRPKKKSFEELILWAPINSSDQPKEEVLMESQIPIPDRVTCAVPIAIGTSNTPCAGRGTFVLKNVEAGSLIYSVDPPLLYAVDEQNRKHTCDNCLALQPDLGNPTDGLLPNRLEPVKITKCSGCKAISYCSKKCQKEAWDHHHSLECKPLTRLYKMSGGYIGNSYYHIRLLVQMIGHYKKKSLPEADFAGIEALHAHTKELLNTKNSDISKAERAKTSIAMCDMIEHITKTSLKPEKVQELLCQIQTNCLNLDTQHLPDIDEEFFAGSKLGDHLGAAVDPFVSIINHDCAPNAWWTFSGAQLRVGAYRDLAAGQEITFSYVPPVGFVERQARLNSTYNFTCTCKLCYSGADRLREMGFNLTKEMKAVRRQCQDWQGTLTYDSQTLPQTLVLLRRMKEVGLPEWFEPYGKIHMLVVGLYLDTARYGPIDTATLLRSLLQLTYIIYSGDSRFERAIELDLKDARIYQQILAAHKIIPNAFSNLPKMQNLDPKIVSALNGVYWHHRLYLVQEIEKMYGSSNGLHEFERMRLKKDLEDAGLELEDAAHMNELKKVRDAEALLLAFAKEANIGLALQILQNGSRDGLSRPCQ